MYEDFEELLENETNKLNLTEAQVKAMDELKESNWVFIENHKGTPIMSKPNTEYSVFVDAEGRLRPVE